MPRILEQGTQKQNARLLAPQNAQSHGGKMHERGQGSTASALLEGSPGWRSRDNRHPTQQEPRGRLGREGYLEGMKGTEKESNPLPGGHWLPSFSGQKTRQRASVEMQIPSHTLQGYCPLGPQWIPRIDFSQHFWVILWTPGPSPHFENHIPQAKPMSRPVWKGPAPAPYRKGLRTDSAYFFWSFSCHKLAPSSCSPGNPQALLWGNKLSGKYALHSPRSSEGLELP